MSTDNAPEIKIDSPRFPFDTTIVATRLKDQQPTEYSYIADQMLKEPEATHHFTRADNPTPRLSQHPPYMRHRLKPLVHDDWIPSTGGSEPYTKAGRLCFNKPGSPNYDVILRLEGAESNVGKDRHKGPFWSKSTEQVPYAQNFELSIDCTDPTDPKPGEIIPLGSDAEVAVGGIDYLTRLKSRFMAQDISRPMIDALFNITTPLQDKTGWFHFEHRLEAGYNYLLPPAIEATLKEQEGIDLNSPNVTAFVEHTPKGARVTVVDEDNDEFLIIAETYNGIYLLNGDFDKDGKQKDEYVAQIPDKDIQPHSRLFQWLPTVQTSICTGTDGNLLIARQSAQVLVDCRQGRQLSHRETDNPVFGPLFIEDVTVAIPLNDDHVTPVPFMENPPQKCATVSTAPKYSPLCQKKGESPPPLMPTILEGFLPDNSDDVDLGAIAQVALDHELLAHAFRGDQINEANYFRALNILTELLRSTEATTVMSADDQKSAQDQYYEAYRKAIKDVLNSL